MIDARRRLERFRKGVETLGRAMPESIEGFFTFITAAQKESVLTVREKELIAIGISLYHRCEECIVVHVVNALEAGCTREEILEAAGMAVVFGGGPSLGAAATVLLEALDAFEGDVNRPGAG